MNMRESADALYNSGVERLRADEPDLALADFNNAADLYLDIIERHRDDVQLLERCGRACLESARLEKARSVLERAAGLAPDRLDLGVALTDAYFRLQEHNLALREVKRVLDLDPNYPAALSFYGRLLGQRSEFEAALKAFESAVLQSEGERRLFERWAFDRRLGCDWREFDMVANFQIEQVRKGVDVWHPLDLMMVKDSSEILYLTSKLYSQRYPAKKKFPHPSKSNNKPIKLAYFSSDFHSRHPISYLMAPVLENHNRENFEIYIFHHKCDKADYMFQRCAEAVDHCIEVGGKSDQEISKLIYDVGIDILVSMGGYTHGGRPGVLSSRPAPIQVGFLGYPGTMAVEYIDYLIADRHVIRSEDADLYTENIVWMPDVYQPTDDKAPISSLPPTRLQEGLPQNAFVFAGFCQSIRLTPEVFDLWMRLLQKAPRGVLWLSDLPQISRDNLRQRAASHGVNPNRLVFCRFHSDRSVHLARHRLADLFLATFPYSAHSTASDALWAGLPVVVCQGETFASRVGASLLKAAGLGGLVTDNLADYERLILELANNPRRLEKIRRQVKAARRGSPFETARYVRHLEWAYSSMMERHNEGLAPTEIAVPSLPRR